MKESGSRTTWKAWESTSGRTAVSIKDSTKTTKSTDSANIFGLMEELTKATGSAVSSMVSENILFPRTKK